MYLALNGLSKFYKILILKLNFKLCLGYLKQLKAIGEYMKITEEIVSFLYKVVLFI